MPILPESHRMHEVKVILSDEPMDKVLLFCRQKQDNGIWKIFSMEYHVHSQSWVDGGMEAEEM